MILYIEIIIGIGILILLLYGTLFIVPQQEAYIIERLGKYNRISNPGLNVKIPFIEKVAHKARLRINQLDVIVETKTKDNVFVSIPVSVQYKVSNAYASFYQLDNPEAQIRSYVFDRVRTALSELELDEAFASKDNIANQVESTLAERMNDYGFSIINTLVTDINPDSRVRESMNNINAAQREYQAAISQAEAEKVKQVKIAEGEAESKKLQGEGIANQRKAIIEGLAQQYEMLKETGIDGDNIELLLMITQYFDSLQEMSKNGRNQLMLLPSNPGGITEMTNQIRNYLFTTKFGEEDTMK